MLFVEQSADRSYRRVGLPPLCSLLFEEHVTAASQRPETQDARGAHHLIMIATEEFLEIIEEGLDPPADRKDVQDRFGVRVQQTGYEIAGVLDACVGSVTHDQNLASS